MSKIPASPGTVRNKIARGNCINLWTVASGALFSIAQDNVFYGKLGMSDYYALYQTMRNTSDCYLDKEACDDGYAYMPPLTFTGAEGFDAPISNLSESILSGGSVGVLHYGATSGPDMAKPSIVTTGYDTRIDSLTIGEAFQLFKDLNENEIWQLLIFRHLPSSPLPYVSSVIFSNYGDGAQTLLSDIEGVKFWWVTKNGRPGFIVVDPDDWTTTAIGFRKIDTATLNSRGYMKASTLNICSHGKSYYPHTEADLNKAIESYSNGIFEE